MSVPDEDRLEVIGSAEPICDSNLETTNASLPVNNLPPEILVIIFTLVQTLYGWPPARGSCDRASPKWLRITWVCQHWRRIALGTPILWSIFVDTGCWKDPSWFPVFLERAGDVPLDVRSEKSRHMNKDWIKPLHPHASRIGRLHHWCLSPDFLSLFSGPFDVLEDLSLSCVSFRYEILGKVGLELSRQRFPSLRKVRLDRLAIQCDTDIFASLQVLEVITIPGPRCPSPCVVLRILQEAPGLQNLKLSVGPPLPAEQAAMQSRADPISHHTLRRLQLSGPPTSLSYIYDRISLSLDCAIAARHYVPENPLDVRSILPVQLAFKPVLPRCTDLSVDMSGRELGINLRRYGEQDLSKVEVTVRLERVHKLSIPPSSLWPNLADALDVAPLTYLSIISSSLPDVSAALWRGFLSRFPHLTHLRISGTRMTRSVSWIHNALEALETHNTSSTLAICPCLQSLELRQITLKPACAEGVLRTLDARAESGVRIPALVLGEAYCQPGMDVGMLRASLEDRVRLIINYRQNGLEEITLDTFRFEGDLGRPPQT